MAAGLWHSGSGDWYGPATRIVQRIRGYRPNRRGQIKLVRWLRVGLLRGLSCAAVCTGLVLARDSLIGGVWHRALVCAVVLAWASFFWRCSLIRVVLRPGEIIRYYLWRHVVVPCSAVKELRHNSWRGGLVLETHAGEKIDFLWFYKSVWDMLYDFSSVCADAMQAHTRAAPELGPAQSPACLQRRFTWSVGADLLAAGAVACLGLALFAAVRG
ncbi:hypothetical protein [Streptomyces hygroscopicus]|uniref:hypothetical protein n=1 Tax=Streptomyces hygroscopicus TaxID=1912 RepID=UPI00223F8179|nr:hypothetical protein [Streptomyces hygroscopicus]